MDNAAQAQRPEESVYHIRRPLPLGVDVTNTWLWQRHDRDETREAPQTAQAHGLATWAAAAGQA